MSDCRRPKVVITNRVFAETRELLARSADTVVNDAAEPLSYEEARARCGDADGLLAFMTDRIDDAFLAACPRLKVIGAALKGYDNIDAAACRARGVVLTIVPDLLTVPTAELAVGLMLVLGRNILEGDRRIRMDGFRGWRPQFYGTGLSGATVALVGFGQVGRAIAGRLAAFGCKMKAYDIDLAPEARAVSGGDTSPGGVGAHGVVPCRTLLEALTHADYVVLALPLTSQTFRLIDASAIEAMKPGALLVNPARGSLVDERAVANAIEQGHLGGYAADVFECEDWAQSDRPRVIDARLTALGSPTVLTPHLGSAVAEVRRQIELSAASSISRVLAGEQIDSDRLVG